jgi:Sec-independent protein secretion pathway component TatC
MPITFFLAFKYGLLNTNFLIENRAKIVFINLFLAAFISPPDVLIQILLALYLQLMIEVLLLLMFFYKKLQPKSLRLSFFSKDEKRIAYKK